MALRDPKTIGCLSMLFEKATVVAEALVVRGQAGLLLVEGPKKDISSKQKSYSLRLRWIYAISLNSSMVTVYYSTLMLSEPSGHVSNAHKV